MDVKSCIFVVKSYSMVKKHYEIPIDLQFNNKTFPQLLKHKSPVSKSIIVVERNSFRRYRSAAGCGALATGQRARGPRSPGQAPEEVLEVDGHGQLVGGRRLVPVHRVTVVHDRFRSVSAAADETFRTRPFNAATDAA